MRLRTGFLAILLIAAGLPVEAQDSAAWTVKNGYWLVRGQGAVITEALGDPTGKGRHTARFAGRLYPGDTPPQGGTVFQPTAQIAIVRNAVYLTNPQRRAVEERQRSVRLEAGHTLAQSFVCGEGLAQVEACLPTWYEAHAAVTLTLHRGSREGPVVTRERFRDVTDNGWVALAFPPQPAGTYWLVMSDPERTVGWWAEQRDALPDGACWIDGQEQAGIEFDLRFTCYTPRPAGCVVALEGDTLRFVPQVKGLGLRLETPWQAAGYGLEPRERHWFRRFISHRGQYLPAEQLKRRQAMDFGMDAGEWLHLGGAWGADWRLSRAGGVDFRMTGDTLTLVMTGEALAARVMKAGWVPDFLPRFTTSDPKLTATLNDFLWERALSWPLDSGLPDWMEWLPLIRNWMDLPGYLERERAHLLAYRMAGDGYVYTWGDSPEWPFPDNAKYDARHYTTNANFVNACYRYWCWTGDTDFLRVNAERIRRAMAYQLRELWGSRGMLVMTSPEHDGTTAGIHSNYWDDLPFGWKSAYENIYFAQSLLAMAAIERALGDMARSRYFDHLHRTAITRYRSAFWNDKAGRFIGCLDRTGQVHDYGFSYVNLEAMAYGLATPEQARRIYRWLEQAPTQTGKADAYSAYRFAPRVNTLDCSGWWYLHGLAEIKSQPFGKHCENGGAILYTSGFDLMARARYLGADNAFARLQGILARYREADRLCGGSPLVHGEVNGWEVGTDVPFPESGLAPAAFLYAFLGVQALPDGLHVRPNLPRALQWAGVERLVYRGLPLSIRVTRSTVRISCTKSGYRFTITRPVRPGGEYVLKDLPGRLRWPVRPSSARWQAKWIWAPAPAAPARPAEAPVIYARRTFTLDRLPRRALALLAADNDCILWVNGQQVGRASGWQRAARVDVRQQLRVGQNLLAVQAANTGGPAGVLVELRLDGRVLGSDASWLTATVEQPGWQTPAVAAAGWPPACEIGPVPVPPWGEVR